MKIGIAGHQVLESEPAWQWVRCRIHEILARYPRSDVLALSCLAAGADQEFADIAMQLGIQVHAIIPCRNYENALKSPDALLRLRIVLGRAAHVLVLDFPEPTEDAFQAAGKKVVNSVALLVAVWDGKQAKAKGGTAEIVEYAKSRGRTILHLNPSKRA